MSSTKTKSKYSVYKAKDGWRWRCKVGSKITAVSGEAFDNHFNAQRAMVDHVSAHFHCGFVIDKEKSLPNTLKVKLEIARQVTHWWTGLFG